MAMNVVSTFSPHGYEVYGRRFVESWLEHWPQEAKLHLYIEPSQPALPRDSRIQEHYLWDDYEYRQFVRRWKEVPSANGIVKVNGNLVKDYRWEAVRFAHKVFAVTKPAVKRGWWVWLDADTETTKPVDGALEDAVCPDGYTASYIGRKDWHHSECGIVGYNLDNDGDIFLKRLRCLYTEALIFGLQEWHDSFVWDFVRRSMEFNGNKFYNITEGLPGMHPWPDSILGEYMTHQKGPQAKKSIYGEVA